MTGGDRVGQVMLVGLRASADIVPRSNPAVTRRAQLEAELLRVADHAYHIRVPTLYSNVADANDHDVYVFDVKCFDKRTKAAVLPDKLASAMTAAEIKSSMCPAFITSYVEGALSHSEDAADNKANKPMGTGFATKYIATLDSTKKATALADFRAIATYMAGTSTRPPFIISDLQGIMEASTGRFYLFDPGFNEDATDADVLLLKTPDVTKITDTTRIEVLRVVLAIAAAS